MLVPPVAQGGTGSRQVGDAGVRSAHNSVPGTATALWPLAPAHANLPGSHQSQATPPLAATPGPPHNQGINRYELYSLFPGSNGGSYVATAPATPSATPGRTYHATTHKVSESVFSAAVGVGVGGYTWGAPTPPPGSPYSPVPGVTQLELLAKNLASLAPHHPQQPLTLQGVGVNVGASVHHAQHTQHTLNLAGLHHLHHGGIHQGTFSPQLSLVTAGTPTLTINSFSSPNTQASVVPTNGGLLVQEYQPGEPNNQIAVCPSSTSGSSSIPTATAACTVSTVIVQGAQTGSTFVQSTMKKRESFVTAQAAAQTSIKLENKTTRQSCICKSTNVNSSGKTKVVHSEAGCSRTLPVVSSWNGQDTSSCTNTFNQSAATNLIKREPLAAVPCQVAEVSTSLHATTTAVKIEPLPPKSENGIVVSTAAASGIPVGIAVARQRLQHHQETSSTSMRNVSLSHHTSHHASYHHFQPDNLGSTTAMAMGGATLVHCGTGGEDRPAHLAIPSGAALAPSLSATLNSGLSNIGPSAPGTWPPTLWQYPTTAMPSLEPVGFPQLGVGLQGGLQLVRDPTSGHLLLIHAAEQMQQAVVWPNYPSVHSAPNIGAPPLLLPGPTTPPSLQLLSDINGARLVLTENKRKQQNNVPIVKIEADCAPPNATIIASAESSKALQTVTTMTGSLVTDTPLLTTLHYYPHAPALVQISQSESMQCRTQQRNTFISKATSPVSCLTPPPEVMPAHAIETLDNVLNVQDASNQTDAPETEDDHPSSIEIDGLPIKQEQVFSSCHQTTGNFTNFDIVSSSIERPRLNSITEPASDVHKKTTKVDKALIAPLSKDLLKTEAISSIDQAIDSVVCKSTEEDDEFDPAADEAVIEERVRRRPSRVIEITEENCDSFHENLEFFGRRKDPVELHRKPQYSEEMFNKEKLRCEELSIDDNADVTDDANVDKDYQQPVSSTLVISEQTEDTEDVNKSVKVASSSSIELLQSSDQVDSSCSPCEKIIDDTLISGKSLDMPSIDCDEEVNHHVNVKVKEESIKSNNYEECPVVNDNNKSLPDKLNRTDKKHNNNDKFHAGIENVVEKLKKNAAAAQQDNSSLAFKSNDKEQIDNNFNNLTSATTTTATATATPPVVRSVGRCLPRTLNNGLKKHILRFYETESLISENVNSNSLKNDDIADKNDDVFKKDAILSNNNNDKLSQVVNPTVISEKTKNLSSKVDTDEKMTDDDDDVSCKLNIKSSGGLKNLQTLQQYKNNQTGKIKSNVDLSGLELLSNSIAQLEHLKPDANDNTSSSDIENSPVKQKGKGSQENNNNVDSPLGLLCALAEQRFMEEVGDDVPKLGVNNDNAEDVSHAGVLLINLAKVTGNYDKDKNKDTDKEKDNKSKCEKRRHSVDAYVNAKKPRKDLFYSFDNNEDASDDLIKNKYSDNYEEADDADDDCTDSDNDENKISATNDKGNGNLSPVEVSMRERLADIKKKYKDTQNELLAPLDQDLDDFDGKLKQYDDIPSHDSSRFNKNLIKLAEPRSHIKLLDSIPSISIPVPVAESPVSKIVSEPEDEDNKNPAVDYDTSSSSPTVRSSSSAKKRKVGRPKKLMCSSTSARHLTETIVAKKSRSKSSLVSCLVNSKNRHANKLNGKAACGLNSKAKVNQAKVKPIKQTPLHNKNVICSIIAEKAKLSQDSKLEKQVIKFKPKFKNHSKVKEWNEDDKEEWDYSADKVSEIDTVDDKCEAEINNQVADKFPHVSIEEQSVIKDDVDDLDKKDEFEHHEKSKKKKRKSSSSSPMRRKSSEHDKKESKRRKSSDCKECKECAKAAKAEKVESIANKCKLVSAHLEIDQLRVLTAMGGLFYAGRLSAVQAPDIYAITLDGERGNRPHIHSREEILRDAIVEICPTSTKELLPGTRLCAYWSQQYRCLYPGTSVESSEPDSDLDDKFVSVEFDDGDSGRIALDDIRLLLPDYPVVEYDPNPLLTLGKKRRLTSMSDDKRSDQSVSAVTSSLVDNDKIESENNTKELDEKSVNEYRERKKLKKRRRDKLKRLEQVQDGKKRHKRHKCCEEHRKHKHRKHRKHKHKHAHHSSHNESSHFSGGESCSGLRTDEEEDEEDKDRDKNGDGDGDRDRDGDATNEVAAGKDFINEELEVENEVVQVQEVDEEPVVEEKNDKTKKSDKKTKARERQESVESRSKMAAFLPARQLWGWAGKGYRRPGAKGRAKKQFFKAIQRGTETIQIGDSAVFLSTGRPDRPYIGKIESMWETTSSNMIVKVKWFYHPEETVGCPANLKYPGALFESPHMDENDVQTISHKCEVLPLQDYTTKLGKEPHRYLTIYDNNDIYYLAGYYDPTTYLLTLQPGVA